MKIATGTDLGKHQIVLVQPGDFRGRGRALVN